MEKKYEKCNYKTKIKIGINELEVEGTSEFIIDSIDRFTELLFPDTIIDKLVLAIRLMEYSKQSLKSIDDFAVYCELIEDIQMKLKEEIEVIQGQ